jgi:hypothetical protein
MQKKNCDAEQPEKKHGRQNEEPKLAAHLQPDNKRKRDEQQDSCPPQGHSYSTEKRKSINGKRETNEYNDDPDPDHQWCLANYLDFG